MNFKDLKAGAILYILNKDNMALRKGSVISVTQPHIENKSNSITQLVVDVTVNCDGKPITYVMPDSGSITYCEGTIITSDKSCLINEIKAIKAQKQSIIDAYESSKLSIEKCDELISELDDAYREKKEADERLSKLEGMMKALLDKFTATTVQAPAVVVQQQLPTVS